MREDWIECKIGSVTNIFPGIGFPKNIQGKKKGEFPFYKVGDISKNFLNNSRILKECNNYVDSIDITNISSKLVPKGTVVFAKIGEGLKLNRRGVTFQSSLIDNNTIGLKAINRIIMDAYLFHFFNTIRLEKYSQATTVPSVRKGDIENILIPLPPLPEQRAIVKKIEALFSSLDTGIADLKKAQDQLKIYRQAVLKKAFEGELTKEWRENDVINKVTLKEILSLSSSKHKAEKPEGLFYIGLEHIEKDSGKLTEHVGIEEIKTVKNKFEANNILYGKLRPYLNKVYFSKESGVCSTDILVFKISEKVIGKFIHLFMLSREFVNDMSNNTSGVNLPRVSTKYIENYLVPLPSIEEQNQIVKEIESRLSVCDAVEQQIKESLSQAEALRQSILKKAFEGTLLTEEEIDACKQEPHYEPASILLEKIKAEKEANKPAKKKTTKKKTTE